MASDELFEKLRLLVADKLEVDKANVKLESRFREDLGADSLDTYELLYAIQSELDITIDDEKAAEFETVGDAYSYVKEQLK